MSPDVPEPLASHPSDEGESKRLSEPRPLPDTHTSGSVPPRTLWAWALAAGVLAGVLSGIGGEMAWRSLRVAMEPRIVPFASHEEMARIIRSLVSSSSVTFIQQGAILGAVLGLAGGLARHSVPRGMTAAAAGLALGMAATAGAAYIVLPIYYREVDLEGADLTYPLLAHGAIWAMAGAAAGLAFGLGLGGRGRVAGAALGGLLGGVGATMIYDVVGALAFPLDKTTQPVSISLATRLLAQFAVALLVAAGAGMGARDRAGTPGQKPSAP